MSIVLVIIGLIVGGILVGQDLVRAAAVRATISQIEKYNAATNTFHGKYGYLPGDIKDPEASSFGFAARGTYTGEGDGNGIIQSNGYNTSNPGYGLGESMGENPMFWVDLSKAGLIDGSFNTASPTALQGSNRTLTGTPNIDSFIPQAKLGNGNYIYIWSGGVSKTDGKNYYGISAVTVIGNGVGITSAPGLSVQQAYGIDAKIDDGFPQMGNVTAIYGSSMASFYTISWAGTADTSATTGSSSTCYDNGGSAGTQQYSLKQNNGAGINCAVSIKMQAGD